MASNSIFQENREIDRLVIQNRLLKSYEQPIYQRIISGRSNLKLLDIGSNDGSKIADRFSCKNITQVIGLEYHHDLAAQAQKTYGSDRFAFHQCDVEGPDFTEQLSLLMAQNGVNAFDIIHISFVLMHLKNPGKLLTTLRRFLAPGGRLISVEADDSLSKVTPDTDHLFKGFLDILYLDPFSGDRDCGGKLPVLLAESGYRQIVLENTLIRAGASEAQKKSDIFTTFFSYLPQDVLLLQGREPRNARYAAWAAWLEQHIDALQNLILAKNTDVSMGVSVITCSGGRE